MRKKLVAPSVISAARAALTETAIAMRNARNSAARAKTEWQREKAAADIAELEVKQLEGFLRDCGDDEAEIKQLKGET